MLYESQQTSPTSGFAPSSADRPRARLRLAYIRDVAVYAACQTVLYGLAIPCGARNVMTLTSVGKRCFRMRRG
jgi:hypothetical protein